MVVYPPAVHELQLEDPGELLSFPAGQGVHDVARAPLNVPIAQRVHEEAPSTLDEPGRHGSRSVPPSQR